MQYGRTGSRASGAIISLISNNVVTSLPYQIAGIITSGPTPLIATYLFATYGQTLPISMYIAATGLLSLVCAFFLAETFKRDLSAEPEDEAAAAHDANARVPSPHSLSR